MTLLVPKQKLGRANGMVQLAEGVAQILSPVTAGALIGIVLVQGIMAIDLATFLFAIITLVLVRIPKPVRTAEGQEGKGSIFKEALFGWKYIRDRRGLKGMLLFFASFNFLTSIAVVLFTPLVLGFSTAPMLGLLTSVAGLGYLTGSIVMSTWGGPKRKVMGLYLSGIIVAASLLVLGFTTNPFILGIGAFLAFSGSPIMGACSQVIWQRKTAPDIQGRVFAYRRVISFSSIPLAYMIVGPLADRVFNPLLMEGGRLSGSIGRLVGVGPGRGIGLMFVLLGVLVFVATAIAFSYPELRNVEENLPDMSTEGIAKA